MKRFFLFFICSLIGLAGQLCAQGHFSHIVEEEKNISLPPAFAGHELKALPLHVINGILQIQNLAFQPFDRLIGFLWLQRQLYCDLAVLFIVVTKIPEGIFPT